MAEHMGVVKWFNNAKGFGFLGRDDGPDVFVHYSSIQADGYRMLKEGDLVAFDIVTGEQGRLQANKVSRIENDDASGNESARSASSPQAGSS